MYWIGSLVFCFFAACSLSATTYVSQKERGILRKTQDIRLNISHRACPGFKPIIIMIILLTHYHDCVLEAIDICTRAWALST